MNIKKLLLVLPLAGIMAACSDNSKNNDDTPVMKSTTDAKGRTYEYVEGDPMNVRIYTLGNGLKIYLTQNKSEPTIQTLIPVRAGSTYDPKETTGLAHYLEHLMFKGTEELGTIDWKSESALLDQISDAYEAHKAESDPAKKKVIYKKIDSLSSEAAKFAVPNEYDKAISSIGGKGTNAFTSNERTVYVNTIPANELEKWVKLEADRFGSLVMRLFHTELETVYEEFNRGQDQDGRKVYAAMNKNLFAGHPYGEQTTIGEGEHLKNPSMVNIRNYYNTYYKANNVAICMSGDFEFDNAVDLIEKYWGNMEANETLDHPKFDKLAPITESKSLEVFGPDKESISIGFRLDGAKSRDTKVGRILSELLSNGKAGLIDIDLVQKQKLLDAYAYSYFLKDYGMFQMYATVREGQSLDEAKTLLMAELDKVKKGEFDQETLDAIINNLRKSEIAKRESNYRAYDLVESFILDKEWTEMVTELKDLEGVTKEELVKFANDRFNDNYVAIYKRTGEDTTVMKVEKPEITPLTLNRDTQSTYLASFTAMESPDLQPVFIDFKKDIASGTIHGNIPYSYIENTENELFKLIYVLEMGSNNDKEAALAFEYLPFMGTSKYSPEQLQKEFYKYGLEYGVSSGDERTYVYLEGLQKSAEKGIELMEHLLAEAKGDPESYSSFVDGQMKKRSDAKMEKWRIQYMAMPNYAKYGPKNPFTNILTEEEMRAINPDALTSKLKALSQMEHQIFYYGMEKMDAMQAMVEKYHPKVDQLQPLPQSIELVERAQPKTEVYFIHRDQVQCEVNFLAKDATFDASLLPMANLYNTYYGRGLSSIIFQEIREAKGLAYTAYSSFTTPGDNTKSFYNNAYVGTQSDKLAEAMRALYGLLNEMPKVSNQLEESKKSILKQIASDRRIKDRKYFMQLSNNRLGIDYDYRKDVYAKVQNANMDDMNAFFNEHIKGKNYTIMVMGNKNLVDMKVLEKYGKVTMLSMEDIFGY
ncbi:MAG: insulinase family protein [Flavobacteriales bacterium]|nr:insulinase family protein [Flavobacteriales bacterium]